MAGQEPRANFKTPITVEEVLGSRMIAYPFRLLQCCLVTDRGGALILVAAERARSPVHLLGTGESVETPTVTGSAACSSPPAESLCRASRSSSTGFRRSVECSPWTYRIVSVPPMLRDTADDFGGQRPPCLPYPENPLRTKAAK